LFLTLAGVILFTFSCSTKKNTWSRRAYHRLTCHYNVFWNGIMSLDQGVDNLDQKVVDDYSKILRVYNYGDKKDAKQLTPKMDRAIKKASIAIQRHSMIYGKKQKIKWVADSYLLMGKAYFYKQEYTSARRVFKFIYTQYKYFPIHYDGLLWLAKTNIETAYFQKAEAELNLLTSKQDKPDCLNNVYRRIPLVTADFYLAQEQYNKAYPYLERALELAKNSYMKARIEFILGQIDQKQGDFERAASNYKKVIKRNPPFKMAFEAKLNIAKCYTGNSGNSEEIVKVLKKMAKDAKNKEYLDQIYYALADIALKNNNDTLAVNYLQQSVSASTNNRKQKAVSSLKLADLYFNKGSYIPAQAYYDTAVSFLPVDFPNKKRIQNKALVLSTLVQHLETIHTQDSLQKLSKMDSTSLYALIDQKIVDYRELQQQKQEAAQQLQDEGGTQFVTMGGKNPGIPLGGGGSNWYFYNATTKTRGYSEFLKKWGRRKLEDNWFLSDKRQIMSSFGQESAATDTTRSDSANVTGQNNPESRAFYMKNLLKTDAEFHTSDSLMIDAYNKLGFLYIEELNDTTNALKIYLKFQERFPDNRFRLEAWYALYKIFKSKKDTEKKDHYKKLILSYYPKSNYAKVIVDPNYFVKLASSQNKAAQLYEKTYNAFSKGEYLRVIAYADRGLEQAENDTALTPRFLYLKAIARGKVNVPDTLYTALKLLVKEYPQSAVSPMSRNLMQTLSELYGIGDTLAGKKGNNAIAKEKNPYVYEPNTPHFTMLVVLGDKVKVRPLKVRLSDFNRKYFRMKSLHVKSLLLDNQRTLITVGNFRNKDDAANYYTALKGDEYVFSGVDPKGYFFYTISMKNYPVFYRDKNIEVYKKFWKKYYGNK